MLIVEPSVVEGRLVAPPSKSATHRALALGLLSARREIVRPLWSNDTRATAACVRALGGRLELFPDRAVVFGGRLATPDDVLDCANSGTTLRLFTPLAALAPGAVVLTGDPSLRKRPLLPLLSALAPLGVEAWSTRGSGLAPIVVRGPLRGGRTRVPGDVSSQFVSALLLAGARSEGGLTLELTTPLRSRSYVAMTLEMLAGAGGRVECGEGFFRVPGRQELRAETTAIPGDWSGAAFPLAAAAVTGGEVCVEGLDPGDVQGDRAVVDALRAFGCEVEVGPREVTVARRRALRAARLDLGDTPDLFPPLCAVAAHAEGETVLSGAPHLRLKECDRIAAMVGALRRMGVDAEERDDGATIRGGAVRGTRLLTQGDHRVLMALTVCALGARGTTALDEHASAQVSYPSFVEDLRALGASLQVDAP